MGRPTSEAEARALAELGFPDSDTAVEDDVLFTEELHKRMAVSSEAAAHHAAEHVRHRRIVAGCEAALQALREDDDERPVLRR